MKTIKPYSLKEDRLVTFGRLLELHENGQDKTQRYLDLRRKYLDLVEKEEQQRYE